MDTFDCDNVLLLPRKCRVESRSECDASAELGGRSFRRPVVPANMKTVIDEPISEWLTANDHFYVMHPFDLDNIAYARRMHDKGLYGLAHVLHQDAPSREQLHQPGDEALQQCVQLVVGGRIDLDEARRAIGTAPLHAVQYQAVQMDVEVRR